MIGTLITCWFILVGCYLLFMAGLRLAWKLPAAIAFVVCLPALPFVVAWRNRRQHPVQSKILYCLWGILYAILIPLCFFG